MTTETNTTEDQQGLSAAIEKVREITLASTKPEIHHLEAPTGKSGEIVKHAVVFLPDGDGGLKVVSLVDVQKAAIAAAEVARLAKADGPDTRAGTAVHETLESLLLHVNRFKDPQNSAVWAARSPRPRLDAVIDYHHVGNNGKPGWGRHRATYEFPFSEEWIAWGGGKVLNLNQDQLGEFLLKHDMDLIQGNMRPVHGGEPRQSPPPAWLLNMANKLEITASATAKRVVDPNTQRVTLQYTEEAGVVGEVVPPPGFLVMIPVFQGEKAQEVEIRLTVKVPRDAKAANFTLQIHSAEMLVREAFDKMLERVTAETGLQVFQGTPEK
jgi:hypothetical protein